MQEQVIQALIRLYSGSREPAALFDAKGRCLWHSEGLSQPEALREVLDAPGAVRLTLDGRCYEGRCLEEPDSGIRVVRLTPVPQLDEQSVRHVMHTTTLACQYLHGILEENGLAGEEQLETIMGSVYRIYRQTYLQRAAQALTEPLPGRESFGVRQTLLALWEQLHNLLRDCAEVEDTALELPEDKTFLAGTPEEFCTALLAAVTRLCAETPEVWHTLHLSARTEEASVVLTLTAQPLAQEISRPQSAEGFGPLAQEEQLLQRYCQRMGGSFTLDPAAQPPVCRITLPRAEMTGNISLGSQRPVTRERYFNLYEVMLSRLYHRRFL